MILLGIKTINLKILRRIKDFYIQYVLFSINNIDGL